MLKTRIISACVFVPVILLAVFFGGWIFAALMLAIAVLGGYEYGKLLGAHDFKFLAPIYYTASVLLILLSQLFCETPGIVLSVLFLCFAAAITLFIFKKVGIEDIAMNLMGILYIPTTLTTAIFLRSGLEDGMFLLFLLLIIEWFTDTGAYLIGSSFGKHKLLPSVSPKKSVEGFVGGIVVAVIGALLLNIFTDLLPIGLMVITAIVVSVGGQLGDLCESAFKRWAGVKDSGTLIPGHGGILDRFDSMLFASPLLYLFVFIFTCFI